MMALSLYEAVIPSQLQILGAVDGLIARTDADAGLIAARLAPDMLPFGYQVKACVEHSVAAADGVRAGMFCPSTSGWPGDTAGLHALLRGAVATLEGIDRAEFDRLADRRMEFVMGDMRLPFTGAQFLLSFSQPNFYFHATTAYAILRAHGVKLGKTAFLGRLRIGHDA